MQLRSSSSFDKKRRVPPKLSIEIPPNLHLFLFSPTQVRSRLPFHSELIAPKLVEFRLRLLFQKRTQVPGYLRRRTVLLVPLSLRAFHFDKEGGIGRLQRSLSRKTALEWSGTTRVATSYGDNSSRHHSENGREKGFVSLAYSRSHKRHKLAEKTKGYSLSLLISGDAIPGCLGSRSKTRLDESLFFSNICRD